MSWAYPASPAFTWLGRADHGPSLAVGSVALGSAIAFGLGEREVAARMLEDAYRSGRNGHDEYRGRPPASVRRDRTLHTPNTGA